MKILIIFVHYDQDNILDPYVLHYINKLKEISGDIVFVSTSKLAMTDISVLENNVKRVIIRENIGYDFMSYKIGMESENYDQYDLLIFANDSMYGPLLPLFPIIDKMTKMNCDFWGLTESYSIAYHLQSYFLVFKQRVFQSKYWKDFWNNFKILNEKIDIVEEYEVGLSQYLIKVGFKPKALIENDKRQIRYIWFMIKKYFSLKACVFLIKKLFTDPLYLTKRFTLRNNQTHSMWDKLLNKGFPFIKIDLLKNNPLKVEINNVNEIIKRMGDYDNHLIKNHLNRIKSKK